MIRRHRLKICFLALMIVIALPLARGRAAAADEPRGPFRVKIELAPDLPGASSSRAPLPAMPDLPAGRYDDGLLRRDLGANREDIPGEGRAKSPSAGLESPVGYFRLTFSGSSEEQHDRDLLRFGKEGDDTLSKIRSLPSLLGNSSPRDAFGTIGDVFRPRLNLEIDF